MRTTVLLGVVTLFAWVGVITAAMWALVTLNRIRGSLNAMRAQLDRVEQTLRRGSASEA